MSEKLDMQSPDMVAANVDKIAAIFPNCVTETASGKAVDFDLLKQELNHHIVEGTKERYRLEWPGKREAIVMANIPTTKTLRPIREDSVDFDTTENLYIEGDNLEVLKLLQESYLNKIKMIYIDPPYNTGKDFVYNDNFRKNKTVSNLESGLIDEEGNKLVGLELNPETNATYHSDWLSMMYPRLKLARYLMTEDGVIFISIDDNEVHNLRKLCDEVFGEGNFVANFIWNSEGHTDNQFDVKINHEYILVYAKNIFSADLGYVVDPNTRSESNLWKGYAENSITKNGPGNPPSRILLPIGFPTSEDVDIESNKPEPLFFKRVTDTGYITRQITIEFNISYPIREDRLVSINGKLTQPCNVYSGWANANKLKSFIENKCEPIIEENGDEIEFYLSKNGVIYYKRLRAQARNILSVLRNMGTTEQMRSQLEQIGVHFQYPKPIDLLKYLVNIGCTTPKDIVMDFFSGSAGVAEAVMEINVKDNGLRKFILVQLNESTNSNSEAYKAGYKNICEIGKERIRRAGKKIKESLNQDSQDLKIKQDVVAKKNKDKGLASIFEVEKIENENQENSDSDKKENQTDKLDIGFRVYRLAESNMKDVYYRPQDFAQDNLDLFEDNIKPDRTPDDLLTQVILDWGLSLSLPIEQLTIANKHVFKVAENSLFACFDSNVDEAFAKELATYKPLRVVFKDKSFKDNSAKENVKQLLKQLSADTEMKVI